MHSVSGPAVLAVLRLTEVTLLLEPTWVNLAIHKVLPNGRHIIVASQQEIDELLWSHKTVVQW